MIIVILSLILFRLFISFYMRVSVRGYYKASGRNSLLKYADPIIGIDYFFLSKLHVSCLIAIGDCILKLMYCILNLLSADDAVSEGEWGTTTPFCFINDP